MLKLGRNWPWKTVSSHFHLPVWPMLLYGMALVSFRLFCKNLGNLQEIVGKWIWNTREFLKKMAECFSFWLIHLCKGFGVFKIRNDEIEKWPIYLEIVQLSYFSFGGFPSYYSLGGVVMRILDLNSTLLGSRKVVFIMYTTGGCGVGGRGFWGGSWSFLKAKVGMVKFVKAGSWGRPIILDAIERLSKPICNIYI